MSLSYGDFFLLGVGFACAALLYIPLLVVLHVLMPKEIVDQYWKTPHFRHFELALCNHAIYAPLRTQMLIAAMTFPRIAKKRHITDSWSIVPRWYRKCASMLIVWGLISFVGFIAILLGFYIYLAANDLAPSPNEFDWTGKMLLTIFLCCVTFPIVRHLWPKHRRPSRNKATRQSRNTVKK